MSALSSFQQIRRNVSCGSMGSATSNPASSSAPNSKPARSPPFVPIHKTQLPPSYLFPNSSSKGPFSHKPPSSFFSSSSSFPAASSLFLPLAFRAVVCLLATLTACAWLFLYLRPAAATALLPAGGLDGAGRSTLAGQVEEDLNARGGWAIIIDAGSSGSRIHVFRWSPGVPGDTPTRAPIPRVRGPPDSLKVRPGLSSFSARPRGAGGNLQPLLAFARERVPRDRWARTPIKLMATAGLRRLAPPAAAAILDSCRAALARSGFLFRRPDGAAVISGTWEGLYAWVAANYAHGTLGHSPLSTIGILELGGASAQVTFVPEDPPPPEYTQVVSLGGVSYKLYAHSFLHFGQEAAAEGAVRLLQSTRAAGPLDHPCMPRGYRSDDVPRGALPAAAAAAAPLRGTGDYASCHSLAARLLSEGPPAANRCERCAIGGAFLPPLRGAFLATENFFYTSEFLKLPPAASVVDLEAAGRGYCSEEWGELRAARSGAAADDLLKYCFSAAYIVALLRDGLGIGDRDVRVNFTNHVQGTPVDWALGALIVELSNLPLSPVDDAAGHWSAAIDSLIALGILFVLLLSCAGLWSWKRTRKFPVKTIYDLEKGRYFTLGARSMGK